MCRQQPPTRFSLWFGKRSPLSVSSEYERAREGGTLFFFFSFSVTGADHQVNEKESHLERGGVCSFTPVISCRCSIHPSIPLRFHVSRSSRRGCPLDVACSCHAEGCIAKRRRLLCVTVQDATEPRSDAPLDSTL